MKNISKIVFSMVLLMTSSSMIHAYDAAATEQLQKVMQSADYWEHSKNEARIKQLIGRMANPNIRNSRGETPLMAAVSSKNAELVKEVVAAGADLNAIDQKGKSVLTWAVEYSGGIPNIIEILLAKGANPDIGIPLHTAIAYGYDKVVEALLNAGAKIMLVSPFSGTNALEDARSYNDKGVYMGEGNRALILPLVESYSQKKKLL